MARRVILYAIALALAVAALEWLEYRYLTRAFSTQIYIVLLAAGFAGLGLWAGHRLTQRRAPTSAFERNDAAIRSLGLTTRECEILGLLASGRSTKEIARQLDISPTTKTHLARIYEKLEVQRRTQAIHKARGLALIP
jgi:DNA-binding CsgD family transcriptional regulator